nr:hypothetical protein [Micromonospora sp. DSM 115978]
MIDQIRDEPFRVAHLENLPETLDAYYAENIGDWGDTRPDWDSVGLPLLATLAAARAPMPRETLAAWAGISAESAGTLLRGPFRPFISRRATSTTVLYGLAHQSLRDLCEGRLSPETSSDS